MGKVKDLTDQKFERLTVIERDYEKQKLLNSKESYWKCKCNCGSNKIISVRTAVLKNGHTKSCGCLSIEKLIERSKKYNTYNLENRDCAIGYTFKNEPFYFDLEDYNKIKGYCWRYNSIGYLVTTIDKKIVLFHRFIMDAPKDILVDHINGDITNNMKNNLRFATKAQNCQNSKTSIKNTSGRKGVEYTKAGWGYQIQFNNKRESKHGYKNFEEAVKARQEAEIRLHKDFRRDENLL